MEGIYKNTFKRMFYDHWDAFKQFRPRFDNPDYNETVNKMLGCGDPDKMGFVQYRCRACGETRRIAFACKSCFCLSCAKVYTDRWADFIARRLLPVSKTFSTLALLSNSTSETLSSCKPQDVPDITTRTSISS